MLAYLDFIWYNQNNYGGKMNVALLCNFITDIKNWIYNWDNLSFWIIISIIGCLMTVSLITLVKSIFGENAKFKWLQFIFFALLTGMLTVILLIRL